MLLQFLLFSIVTFNHCTQSLFQTLVIVSDVFVVVIIVGVVVVSIVTVVVGNTVVVFLVFSRCCCKPLRNYKSVLRR